MVQVTHIRMKGNGSGHDHITDVRWYSPQSGELGTSTLATMVTYIREKKRAYVCDGRRITEVGVVDASPPYLRTYADKVWSDNLLALPRF